MKLIAYALVLGVAAALCPPAGAAILSTDGRGQVLLYPYYTVRGGTDTVITLANTTVAGKALKLRFREGRNGRPVLNLNLYLGPYDVWAAAVTQNSAGDPILRFFDSSCTVPVPAASASVPGAMELAFGNAAYVGYDRAGSGLERAREGYVEVLEMGRINPGFSLRSATGSIDFHEAVLVSPPRCDAVAAAWDTAGAFLTFGGAELTLPTGGLMGSGTLINVAQGTDYAYAPVVLSAVLANKNHTHPDSAGPGLNDAVPGSRVVAGDAVQYGTWSRGVDAVSATLLHYAVWNDYYTAPELNAATDVVLTFPTKPYYVALESDAGTGTQPPFTAPFDTLAPAGPGATGPLLADGSSVGACEPVDIARYGERGDPLSRSDFPGDQRPPEPAALCWTANVITFGEVLQSDNAVPIGSHPTSRDGRIQVMLNAAGQQLTSNEGQRYLGLPVIGFAVHRYVNGNVGGVLSNYGGAIAHRYETVVQ